MLDVPVLRGMATRTQESYIEAVSRLARHYGCRPESLPTEQVQQYLLHVGRASVNQYGCAIASCTAPCWTWTARRSRFRLALQLQRLPQILSSAEVVALLSCAHDLRAHVLLSFAYALGLRVSERCALRVEHIDSAADRICVQVVRGKGGRDRCVPLGGRSAGAAAPLLLADLPAAPVAVRPARGPAPSAACATGPAHALPRQRHRRRISKVGGVHTLRHCYATHLLEAGVDLSSLQQWLDHKHVSTATRYLHLAQPCLACQTGPGASRWHCRPRPRQRCTDVPVPTTQAEVLRPWAASACAAMAAGPSSGVGIPAATGIASSARPVRAMPGARLAWPSS